MRTIDQLVKKSRKTMKHIKPKKWVFKKLRITEHN